MGFQSSAVLERGCGDLSRRTSANRRASLSERGEVGQGGEVGGARSRHTSATVAGDEVPGPAAAAGRRMQARRGKDL